MDSKDGKSLVDLKVLTSKPDKDLYNFSGEMTVIINNEQENQQPNQ